MEIIKIIESFAIIAASSCAIIGINSWRKEIKWRKRYEIAEEVLALFYEARDKIHAIRFPLYHVGEGQSRNSESTETKQEKEILDRSYVVHERYKNNQEVFNKLFSLRYRFIIYYGQDNTELFNNLRKIINQILVASNTLAMLRYRQGKQEDIQKCEGIIWQDYEDPDPINPKIEEIISKIEDICKKFIIR